MNNRNRVWPEPPDDDRPRTKAEREAAMEAVRQHDIKLLRGMRQTKTGLIFEADNTPILTGVFTEFMSFNT